MNQGLELIFPFPYRSLRCHRMGGHTVLVQWQSRRLRHQLLRHDRLLGRNAEAITSDLRRVLRVGV